MNFFDKYIYTPILIVWNKLMGARCLIIRKGPHSDDFEVFWFRNRWAKVSYMGQAFVRDPEVEKKVPVALATVFIALGQKALGIETFWQYEKEDTATRVLDLAIAEGVTYDQFPTD